MAQGGILVGSDLCDTTRPMLTERRMSDVEKRVTILEAWTDRQDVEMAVIRGPVSLEHGKPVDKGALGDVVVPYTALRRLAMKVISGLLVLLAGGATGAYVALRSHLVQVGRDIELQRMHEEQLRQWELRLRCVEGDYLACDHPSVVAPKAP